MKFKKILATFCLALTVLVLTGCSGIHLQEMPNTQDTVYGNGGTSVTKGDYIYYVNSYTSYEGLTKADNETGKVTVGAIYRTKLENGEIKTDDNGNAQNCELVVSKIAGYEFTNLHIFDDYIYYATPNMEYAKDGSLNTSAVDFCRTKLDGTDTQIIYTAKNYDSASSYEVYKIGSYIYLVVFEKDKLVKVEIASHIKSAVTLASDVTSVQFPKISTYVYSDNVETTGTQGYVYYTRNFTKEQDGAYDTENIKGNVLGRAHITDGSKTERKDGSVKYELKDLTNNYIFVVKDVDIYAIDASFPISGIEKGKADIRLTKSSSSLSVSNFYATKNNDGYIYTTGGASYFVENIKAPITYELTTSSEIVAKADDANYVYYDSGTVISRLPLRNAYYNTKKFTLRVATTLAGKAYNAGDEIPAFTFITKAEYDAMANTDEARANGGAVDKTMFTKQTEAEKIAEESNMSSEHIDYTKSGEVFAFVKYTGKDDDSQYYLTRIVINSDHKVQNTDDDDNVIDPTNWSEWNLGYKQEVVCPIDSKHKS